MSALVHLNVRRSGAGRCLQAHLPRGEPAIMQATGHCPHLSAPAQTVRLIRRFTDPLAIDA
ncbi:hypothetical protein [Azohydromonas lata]|uniref:Uncharacterized protein n=1 Tax=Azohydromonas lata TaxID=45677 RepID=A0ABU5IP63_9BURK|nr:hypothetical protein [Azohydromonas lata]MDZ5460667.1 hypothetical protein [Azohydromonas lata]